MSSIAITGSVPISAEFEDEDEVNFGTRFSLPGPCTQASQDAALYKENELWIPRLPRVPTGRSRSSDRNMELRKLPAEIIAMILEYILREDEPVDMSLLFSSIYRRRLDRSSVTFDDRPRYEILDAIRHQEQGDPTGSCYADHFYVRGTDFPVLFEQDDVLRSLATEAWLRANALSITSWDCEQMTFYFLRQVKGFANVRRLGYRMKEGLRLQHPPHDDNQFIEWYLWELCFNTETLHFYRSVADVMWYIDNAMDPRDVGDPGIFSILWADQLEDTLFLHKGIKRIVISVHRRNEDTTGWRTYPVPVNGPAACGTMTDYFVSGFKRMGRDVAVYIANDGTSYCRDGLDYMD